MTQTSAVPEVGTAQPSTSARTTQGVLESLWRHRLLVLAFLVAGAVLGLLMTVLQPPRATASARVFASATTPFSPIDDQAFGQDPSRYLQSQVEILTSEPVLLQAIAAGAPASDTSALGAAVRATAAAQANVITVTGTGETAEQAATRVDAVIAAYRAHQAAQVSATLSRAATFFDATQQRAAQQRAAIYGDGVSMVEAATDTTTSPLMRNVLVLAIVGLGLAVIVSLAVDPSPARLRRRSARPASRLEAQELTAASELKLGPVQPVEPALVGSSSNHQYPQA